MVASQPPLFSAVNLNDDAILNNDVHGSETQFAQGFANVIQRFVSRTDTIGRASAWQMGN
jgi:hypothetical protein